MMDQQPDANLLSRICRREAPAFDALYERYREAVSGHLRRMLRDADAAEDLLQETFLRVWRCAEQWDGRGSCRGWLLRIATNLALNYLRTRRRHPEEPLDLDRDDRADPDLSLYRQIEEETAGDPETLLERNEQREALQRAMSLLTEEKREVLRLIHEDELEIREAAELLGIPAGTVKSRLHHARKHLAREWKALETAWEEER